MILFRVSSQWLGDPHQPPRLPQAEQVPQGVHWYCGVVLNDSPNLKDFIHLPYIIDPNCFLIGPCGLTCYLAGIYFRTTGFDYVPYFHLSSCLHRKHM